jgi:lysozyme
MAIEILRRRPPGDHIVTDQSIALIQGFEGLHLNAYPDPASALAKTGKGLGDPWTIGWGHTKGVRRGDRCTLDEANAWLREDVEGAAAIVRDSITVPLTAGEFAALTSMAYNFGYLPRSLKACLNGGVTDKGNVMAPGSYADGLLQFPRNCRAQAKRTKGLYRRRLAEACVFSGFPFEGACSPSVIQFQLDERGEIDTNGTTTLEDTLMRARQDMPAARPDVSATLKKPWPNPVKAAPGGALSPDTAELPEGTAPNPAPPVVSAPAVSLAPPSSPAAPKVDAKPPPDPVVIAPKSVDVRSIPYGEVLPENGAKNMSESQRGVGMVIVGAGSLIQIVTARLGVGTAVGAIAFDLSRDPVVIALIATAVVAGIGWLMRRKGTKVMTTGMVNATQVLK